MHSYEENQKILYHFASVFGSIKRNQLIRFGKISGMSSEYIIARLLRIHKLFYQEIEGTRWFSIKENGEPPAKRMSNVVAILLDIMTGREVSQVSVSGDDEYLLSFLMENEVFDIIYVAHDKVNDFDIKGVNHFVMVEQKRKLLKKSLILQLAIKR